MSQRFLLVALGFLAGCGSPAVPMMAPLEATKPSEAFGGVQCSAVRPQTEPDLMAWDPGSRANLNRLRRHGVVAVRYVQQGCNVELELLSNCIGPGGDKAYEYAAYAASQSKVARNATQLYAELPVGAAHLAGKFKDDRILRTDYTLVATAALPPEKTYNASDLHGADCARATHVVSVVYLGGFAMVAGQARLLEGSASVFVGSAHAASEAGVERVDSEGDAEACMAANKERQENPLCAVPLRIGLVALDRAPAQAPSSPRVASAAPPRPTNAPTAIWSTTAQTLVGRFGAGQTVRIRVTGGQWSNDPSAGLVGAEGAGPCVAEGGHVCTGGDGPVMGLVLYAAPCQLAQGERCTPTLKQFVGRGTTVRLISDAYLFLGPNDWSDGLGNNRGSLFVEVEAVEPSGVAPGFVVPQAAPAAPTASVANTTEPTRSVRTSDPVVVVFRNQRSSPVELVWIDFDGRERRYATIGAGASYSQSTYVRHLWLVRDVATRQEVTRWFAVDRTAAHVDIR